MADDTGDPPAKKAKKDTAVSSTSALPMCPYGARCYRKNPLHLKEFLHPISKDGIKPSLISNISTVQIDTAKLPPCPFGAACYRKNLLHFAEYSHPLSDGCGDKDIPPDDSGSDTDVYCSDEEKHKEVFFFKYLFELI